MSLSATRAHTRRSVVDRKAARCLAPSVSRRGLTVTASLPPVMVNSCTGKMGHAAAEALVHSGFQLIPQTFSGLSAGVAVCNIGVRGVPVQLVGPERRQAVLDTLKTQYPNMLVVDYTLAHCVEDHASFYASNGLPFVMGTSGADRPAVRDAVQRAGGYAVLPSPAGEQAASFLALLTSLGSPVPPFADQYTCAAIGRGGDDSAALDLLNPAAAKDIARGLRRMGIVCDEAQVHRLRTSRHERLPDGSALEPEPGSSPTLRSLQGRGMARSAHITTPDGSCSLTIRHYGLDRTAFAVGTVAAARFLAEKMAEGDAQRVYDMADVLRWLQAQQERQRPAAGQVMGNVVSAGSAVAATVLA